MSLAIVLALCALLCLFLAFISMAMEAPDWLVYLVAFLGFVLVVLSAMGLTADVQTLTGVAR